MSVARGFGLNGKSIYMNVCKPQIVQCNFIVDSTNGNGLGLRSLKSNGYIQNVFMNTSAAFTGTSHTSVLIDSIASTAALVVGMPVQGSGIPAGAKIASIVSATSITLTAATSTSTTGSITYQGVGSPAPAAGYALIQFKNNFNYYLGGFSGFVAPVTGGNLTSTTRGVPYVIVSLGTTTAAQWAAAGVPVGLTAAVGMSFFAIATGSIGGTGAVKLSGSSGISSVEVLGDPNLSIANASIAANAGAYVAVQFMAPSFTGSALGTHTHDLLVIGGQAASTTNDVATYAGPILGKEQAANATIVGANSATNGGVVAASAGTPAGTMSFAAAAPAAGSVIGMSFWFDGSSVTVDGI